MSLGVIVIYIYSVGAFAFFANNFDDADNRDGLYCDSVLQCWVTVFHYILIGGVSKSLPLLPV